MYLLLICLSIKHQEKWGIKTIQLIKRLFNHKDPGLPRTYNYDLHCPNPSCDYKWQFTTNYTLVQCVPKTCIKCGKRYLVKISPQEDDESKRIVYLVQTKQLNFE